MKNIRANETKMIMCNCSYRTKLYPLGSLGCFGTWLLADLSLLRRLSRTDAGVPTKDTSMPKSALVMSEVQRIFLCVINT